jgi:hypothetical protein
MLARRQRCWRAFEDFRRGADSESMLWRLTNAASAKN